MDKQEDRSPWTITFFLRLADEMVLLFVSFNFGLTFLDCACAGHLFPSVAFGPTFVLPQDDIFSFLHFC